MTLSTEPCFSKKEINALPLIYIDISLLQVISLPFADCAFNENLYFVSVLHLKLSLDNVEDGFQCLNPCGDRW